MFQAVGSGCLQYYTYAALEGINFCSVLNCDSSTFFNLCSPVPLLGRLSDHGRGRRLIARG